MCVCVFACIHERERERERERDAFFSHHRTTATAMLQGRQGLLDKGKLASAAAALVENVSLSISLPSILCPLSVSSGVREVEEEGEG